MNSAIHRGLRGLGLMLLWGALWARPASGMEVPVACTPNSPDYQAARAALDQLDQQLRSLPPGAAVEPYNQKLAQLLEMPCFRLSAEISIEPAESARSLRTFWEDGGEEWLRSYLRLHGPKPSVVLPPDLRPALASDGAHGEIPSAFLCPAADECCGQETAGWSLRSARALEALGRSTHASSPEPPPLSPKARSQRCWRKVRGKPAPRRYMEWHLCLEEARPRVPALPLGRFRAPQAGWWLLRGRRGHHDFCDEVRVYDLATGAAYVASSCSSLVLRNDGRGACGKTEEGYRVRVRTGRMSVDNLREAALMAVLAKEVRPVQVRAVSYPLPAGLVPRWPKDGGFVAGISGSHWGSTDQTRLSWAIGAGDQILAQGELTWPASAEAGEENAIDLLRVAEAGFEDGCPPAPLPDLLPLVKSSFGASGSDTRTPLTPVEQELMNRLRGSAHEGMCK